MLRGSFEMFWWYAKICNKPNNSRSYNCITFNSIDAESKKSIPINLYCYYIFVRLDQLKRLSEFGRVLGESYKWTYQIEDLM